MKKIKKITIVTMQLHTPGGIERFVTTLANLLVKHFDVTIVANYGRPSDPLAFSLDPRIKLHFLTPVQPAEISLKTLLFRPSKWLQIPTELHRRHSIDLTQNKVFHKFFHNFSTDFIITDRAAYSRLITNHYRGSAIKIATDHNFHQFNHRYINELLQSIQSFNYLVVATNELRDFYAPLTKTECLTIPNPLPSIPKTKSPLTSHDLLSVGRLVPEKDFSLLIDTMAIVHQKMPDAHLTIVGDGKERRTLETQITTLGLADSITLTGWLPQTEIAKLYLASSLYVSTSRTEAFGLTITEAMSYGLPCLALSRASGARAQITNQTGVLLDTSSPDVIAKNITDLLLDRPKLLSLQSNINLDINKYSATSVEKLWLSLIIKS
ncbi:glycosyltransferase [Candidatus Saccharibacteria bacterium]|nr:glycosyltransferase [Candidatus Saccharibacteria bacterium]